MTPSTKKWVFAGLLTLTNVLVDIGMQLGNPDMDFTRPVIAGLIVGGLGRIMGAALAAMVTDGDDAPPAA